MDDRGGSFVAVRRISQGLERGNNTCNSNSAEAVAGSSAWLGRGLSCVCAQRRESDARPSFDLTPVQKSFQDLLQKREGDRSVWEYPFAVAGVNITFMLIQMLDLEAASCRVL
ncbi:ELMO domain-containing protein A-like isoform X4 [Populus alba x Populus x berolinensis]|nr:ELMO domain-containing protein A-like isoform X4 [Populus alba x Populus x berolinensis]